MRKQLEVDLRSVQYLIQYMHIIVVLFSQHPFKIIKLYVRSRLGGSGFVEVHSKQQKPHDL